MNSNGSGLEAYGERKRKRSEPREREKEREIERIHFHRELRDDTYRFNKDDFPLIKSSRNHALGSQVSSEFEASHPLETFHCSFRPKPPVKLPPSLIPSTVHHLQPSFRKKVVANQNGQQQKPITNGTGHHAHHNGSQVNQSIAEKLQWSLGLIDGKGKYLTSENFGCKINASKCLDERTGSAKDTRDRVLLAGTCLKRKQKWTMIYNGQKDCVYLQSPLNHYLTTDKYGRLQCDTDEIDDDDCCFQLEYSSTGQWAFKSLTYGMYLGGDHDQLHCFSKTPQWWSPHLALHPQVIRTRNCA